MRGEKFRRYKRIWIVLFDYFYNVICFLIFVSRHSLILIFRDLLLFKLAFHTYEALSNKFKLRENNSEKKKNEDVDDDIDLVSNLSDESTITVSGPAGPIKDRKM